jgi:hypothetical protein
MRSAYHRLLALSNNPAQSVLEVNELSGSVARNVSGRHSALKGERDETDGTTAGYSEDEISRKRMKDGMQVG